MEFAALHPPEVEIAGNGNVQSIGVQEKLSFFIA